MPAGTILCAVHTRTLAGCELPVPPDSALHALDVTLLATQTPSLAPGDLPAAYPLLNAIALDLLAFVHGSCVGVCRNRESHTRNDGCRRQNRSKHESSFELPDQPVHQWNR
jgi:hypothetical protein